MPAQLGFQPRKRDECVLGEGRVGRQRRRDCGATCVCTAPSRRLGYVAGAQARDEKAHR